MATLEIRGLHKSFTQHLHGGRRVEILRGVDLAVEPGTCTVLAGPSGSGKSSLLRCAYRSARSDAGTIAIAAQGRTIEMTAAADRDVLDARRTLVGLATQFLSVIPRVCARDLVRAEGLDDAEASELLAAIGLPHDVHGFAPATFSGGQRQMLNLALALARPRPLLLLDEVTASLDPERRLLALEALRARKANGAAILAVFHDVPTLPNLVDRVVRLVDGKVAA